MGVAHTLTADNSDLASRPFLVKMLEDMDDKCTRCSACQEDCAFLKKYGTPGELAASYEPTDKACQPLPFECSLCGLCAVVCPEKLNPSGMFLEMRWEKMQRDPLDYYPEHAGYLAYEKRGVSRRFSYYALPENCDAVFFPGCTLKDFHGRQQGQQESLYEARPFVGRNRGRDLCCQAYGSCAVSGAGDPPTMDTQLWQSGAYFLSPLSDEERQA